jgi:hypothetical protein
VAQDTKAQASTPGTSESGANEIAADAYVFGYPLVLMDVTRRAMTAVPAPSKTSAPVNQFAHVREFPDASFTDVVSPNADTLYSSAWLDLAAEPMVLSVPETGKRYYLMELLDAWTNVFGSPGTRTTGNGKQDFAITGPKWTGTLPSGMTEIKAPTNMVWIIGRTQTNGKDDYAAVHAVQDQYALTPLSAWKTAYRPPTDVPVEANVDIKTPPVAQVAKMDAPAFFGRLNALMIANPPSAGDAPAIARFASVGVGPGRALDPKGLDSALDAGMKAAQMRIEGALRKPLGLLTNGWDVPPANTGRYETDYLLRALIATAGLGANIPGDAIYPHCTKDFDGEPLTGVTRYTMRFGKGALPPVKAFWSLTMYNATQAFVDNPLNRYAIGDRDKLASDEDGSVTLYIQHESPGADKESNWLPAPADSFNLVLRLYWPSEEILDGTWRPPAVEKEVEKKPEEEESELTPPARG